MNTVPGAQSTNEDIAKPIPGLSVADSRGGATCKSRSAWPTADLTLNTTGLTFTAGDGADDTTMTFSGTSPTSISPWAR